MSSIHLPSKILEHDQDKIPTLKTSEVMILKIIPLSPIDHVFTGPNSYPISFTFAYNEILDLEHLKRSLDETLDAFWLLRSKLTKISDHSYGFQVVPEGLSFEVAELSGTFREAADPSDAASLAEIASSVMA